MYWWGNGNSYCIRENLSYSSSRITKKQLQCGHLSSIVNNCGTTASKLLQLGHVANTSFVLKTEAEFSSLLYQEINFGCLSVSVLFRVEFANKINKMPCKLRIKSFASMAIKNCIPPIIRKNPETNDKKLASFSSYWLLRLANPITTIKP